MMTKSSAIPSLKLHKATGQGYVLLDGARHYLGRFDAAETRAKSDRLIAEYLGNGRRVAVESSDLLVIELCNLFRKHVDTYYLDANGKPTKEAKHFGTVIKPMRELYGPTPAGAFGPLKLKAIRERLIAEDRARSYVNKLITRLKMMFRWAASEELLPSSVYESLRTVPGLKRGRTTARESDAVKPVPIEHVDDIRQHVSRQVAAIIELQLLTSARPGELCVMRSIDIDMTGDVWIYEPKEHKTAHHGHERKIYLGPKAQEVVSPFLDRPVESFLFSPAEAEGERLVKRSAARTTPQSCGNKPGTNRVRKPRRTAGVRYTTTSYGRAIRRACERAEVAPWHPHQLRHSAATALRKQFGLDIASIMLGHSRCDVTQIYAEKNHEAAIKIAAKVG